MWQKLWAEVVANPAAVAFCVAMTSPILVGAYYRSCANDAYREAAALLPGGPNGKVAASWLMEVLPWLSFLAGGKYFGAGIGLFVTPAWMHTLEDPAARRHVDAFLRYRRQFWICMAVMAAACAMLALAPSKATSLLFGAK